ncbi:hypothetical protein [Chryseobacterium lathyri]|uniref:YD repeat-containing protein n=1 Tax=Chryseobacterium lathyri TaxID=395933 RepID=A0ABT9SI88_9FLAO|nr:hypothetical protein [Chryseobacterium lathyri]MDP9959150.1 hypothetical protein [Chryseobacterium lathyri]
MRKIYISLTLIQFSIAFSQQYLDKVQIKSPQSYAFEKYGNVPINLYTGTLDLKIPIYSIPTSEGKNIDVFVSYDSSGFLPHKKSDFAGMGWSMLAGGRITRTLNRFPDEYQGNPTWTGTSPFDSGVDFHGFLTGVRLNAYTNAQVYDLNSGAGGITGLDWRLGTVDNGYEGEPDIFNFNAMGLSGKFVIGNDGNVLVESEDPNIKVDLSGMVSYGGKEFCKPPNQTIIITDGQGNKYYFGGDFSKYEISYSLPQPGMSKNNWFKGFPYISSFSLSKVEFTNGQTVTFGYVQDTLNSTFCSLATSSSNVVANAKLMNFEGYYQDGARIDDWQNCPSGLTGCGSAISSTSILSENFVLTKRSLLESITYGTHQVKVNYKDTGYPIRHYEGGSAVLLFNEYVIDNIQLFDNSHLIQNNVFTYEDLGGTNKRPFLKNITDPVSNKVYGFEYYNTDNLPKYVTKGIDHWGYWNGNDNNQNLAPYDTYNAITGDYTLNNTFRDPNVQKYNVGLLSKIIYPTKGYSIFEYEAPYYGQRVERTSVSAFLPTLMNNGGAIGGARIKKQYDYSENGGIINNKEYRYTTTLNGTTSSGILMNWPRYIYYIEFNTPTAYQKLMIRSSSNVQQNSLDGYNVGYQKVYEINVGKGITEYNFTSYVDYPDIITPDAGNLREYNNMASPSPLNLYKNFKNLYGTDRTILRGKLKTKTIYSEGSTSPLSMTEFTYNDNIDYNPNNTKDNNNYVSFNHLSGAWVQGYKKYLNSSAIKKKVVTDFLNGVPVQTITDYFHDSSKHLNRTKENITTADNTIISQNYSYAQDVSNSLMGSRNMTGIPVITEIKKNNKTIVKTETVYPASLPTAQSGNLVLPLSVQSYDLQTNSASTEVIYNKYDSKGNLQQYTTKDGIPVSIIWGYNNTQPIAKIAGATYSQVESLISDIVTASEKDANPALYNLQPEEAETQLINKLDIFRTYSGLSDYSITTYTYDPLIGVRSITPPSGIKEFYKYDTANRLEKVIDVNGKVLKEFKYNYKN